MNFGCLLNASARLASRMVAGLLLASPLLTSAATAELVVPGAGPPEAVLKALAAGFNQAQAAHRVTVPPSIGMAGALREVRAGAAVLARMSRRLTPAETREGLRCLPFARDRVVFVTGAAVQVRDISTAQLADVFSGKLADWRELGAAPAPIRVVVRPPGESMLGVIEQHLPAFRGMVFGAQSRLVRSDPEGLELLDRFDHAIGWATQANLGLAKTAVKPLRLNGIAPSAETAANGHYPLAITSCLLYKDSVRDPAAQALIGFVFSPAGRAIIEQLGPIALARESSAR